MFPAEYIMVYSLTMVPVKISPEGQIYFLISLNFH